MQGEFGRALDPKIVEEAELQRSSGDVRLAAAMAAEGLFYNTKPLTPMQITFLAIDPVQLQILACLARIHVDSEISLANRRLNPWQVAGHLEQAAKTITLVYCHEEVRSYLLRVSQDHLGSPHHFLTEMARDRSKTLEAAALLFNGNRRNALLNRAEEILVAMGTSLDEDHPVKPLVGIELQLLYARRGKALDLEKIRKDFETLKEHYLEINPHRVATVASWLTVWGDKLKNEDLKKIGWRTFHQLFRQHPEWPNMAEQEYKKLDSRQRRELFLRIFGPILLGTNRRRTLFTSLAKP